MKGTITTIIFSASYIFSAAQVEINKSISLTGSPQNRTIEGIAFPSHFHSAANAEYVIKNHAHFVTGSGQNSYSANVYPVPNTYVTGMSLHIKIPTTNTGPSTISLNSLAAKNILKHHDHQLIGGELQAGRIVSLVYDGNDFHIVSPILEACPSGFTAVNERYCIQNNEQAASNFYNAVITCMDAGARLCTWGEWYYACSQNSTLNLQNMINNYEWVNDAANEDNFSRITGNFSCQTVSGVHAVNNSYPFRCCFTR